MIYINIQGYVLPFPTDEKENGFCQTKAQEFMTTPRWLRPFFFRKTQSETVLAPNRKEDGE